MSGNPLVVVDVDLTVVDTLTPWLEEFYQVTGKRVLNEDGNYDLLPEMTRLMEEAGVKGYNPYSFWERADLYDNLLPMEGCIQALKRYKTYGWDVVFASACVPGHTKSKMKFLDEFFPFKDGFIATHEKHFLDYALLIDDKLYHMKKGESYRPWANHIMFTGLRVDGKPEESACITKMNHWNELG